MLTKLLVAAFVSTAAAQSRYNPTFPVKPVANTAAVVAGTNFRFTVLADGLLRYEWASDNQFEDRASTFAVVRDLPVPSFEVVNNNGSALEITTSRFHLTYDRAQFSNAGLSVSLIGKVAGTWKFGQATSDLGGTIRTLDTIEGRTGMGHGVLSRAGYGVIDDSGSMLFESDGWIAPRRNGTRSDGYIFAYGHDYKEAMKAFYSVSGSQSMLPRWALGNMWSRYHPYFADEYLALIQHFEDDKVPMSVAVVDMDWHLVNIDPKYGDGWTGYTWNRSYFPDPEGFITNLHNRGLHATLNDHPALGVRAYEDVYPDTAKAMGIDPASGTAIPFDCTSRQFMDAYFDVVHRSLEKIGIDFWWLDWQQGDTSKVPGIDPLWVLNHYTYLDNTIGEKRPFLLSRFGGPGAHRYQAGFSGDVVIQWSSLNFQPEFTATASNIGYGWWSHDIGGHMWGIRDDELTTRWVTLGCFSPILRLHSERNIFVSREPWGFGPEAQSVIEDVMRFRHRMIPYLYTMNYRSAASNEPLVQPMYWSYPEEEVAYNVPNQYTYGSSLMVVPITSPRDPKTHLASVNAWLPQGRWVDIFTGSAYDGNRNFTLYRHLWEYPVLMKEGSIVPLDGCLVPANGAPNPSSIELLVAVGADASFELIEDDGKGSVIDTDSDQKIRFVRTPITYTQSTGELKIGPTTADDGATIPDRQWSVRFIGHTPADPPSTSSGAQGEAAGECSTPNPQTFPVALKPVGTLVHVPSFPATGSATVNIGGNPQLDPTAARSKAYDILWEAQMSYPDKEPVWAAVNSGSSPSARASQLDSLASDGKLSLTLAGALKEMILADTRSS